VFIRRTTPIDRTRRAMAWLAIALWVLGFEVAPNLHLGLHDLIAPHTHGGAVAQHDDDHGHEHHQDADHHHDGAHHHDAEPAHAEHHAHADHHHASAPHEHPHHVAPPVADSHETAAHGAEFATIAPHDAADDARLVATASRLDPAHGDHDLLHRGIAIVEPPAAQPSIAQAPVVVLARLHSLTDRASSRAPLVLRARGPPALANVCRAVDCTA
jgi:hypothetical protein